MTVAMTDLLVFSLNVFGDGIPCMIVVAISFLKFVLSQPALAYETFSDLWVKGQL